MARSHDRISDSDLVVEQHKSRPISAEQEITTCSQLECEYWHRRGYTIEGERDSEIHTYEELYELQMVEVVGILRRMCPCGDEQDGPHLGFSCVERWKLWLSGRPYERTQSLSSR